MDKMIWIWLGAVAVFGVAEAATTQLISIWFVCGAAAAMIAAIAGASTMLQLILFATVSAAALAVTRPLVKKMGKRPVVHTNADRVVGQEARVTETIDNDAPSGTVYAEGKTWTARSADGSVIPKGERVTVRRITGVKLIVETIKTKEAV